MCVKGTMICAGGIALGAILFFLLPQIDLMASGMFYVPGHGFVLSGSPPVVFLYDAVPWTTWTILGIVAAAGLWLFLVGRPIWRLDRKALIFLVASLTLGPGVFANTIFKDHWGRARPAQIEAFGGTRRFTPAPLTATECPSNCSFVSGHAALGFSLVAFAFLLPPGKMRRRVTVAALAIGALIGLGRIAQGAHFLSDVVYAGLLVYATTAVLHWWVVERDALAAPPLILVYPAIWRCTAAIAAFAARVLAARAARLFLFAALVVAAIGISVDFVDRPLALFFHARDPDFRALFDIIGRLGLTYGYLTSFGLVFVALHWGGSFPRLQPLAGRMQPLSAIPAFLFLSIAASGIATDLLKFIFGRLRPKLLFNSGAYDFGWLGLRPDHWSFPSGHTATIVALMTALWSLWPQHLLFYVLVASVVSLSRVAVGAHYLSDVFAGALIAILITKGMALVFSKSGIDLAAARRGRSSSRATPPWPCRRFVGALGRRGAGFRETRSLAGADGEERSMASRTACGSRIGSP
jgi:lipid A 4'-phosphatase